MSSSQILAELHAASPMVAPSLLACDFAELGEEIRRVEQAGAKLLHLDIMDGHFVPNLSFGLPVVEAIRRSTSLPLDVHLMISEPGRYLKRFREAGADLLTIHIEVVADPRPLLDEIRSLGAAAGISLNPPTSVDALNGCLDLCDLVLVMSVMPGFGGQEFEPEALEKLRRLRATAGSRRAAVGRRRRQPRHRGVVRRGRRRLVRDRLGPVFATRLRPVHRRDDRRGPIGEGSAGLEQCFSLC